MRLRIATVVAVTATLVTLAMFSFAVAPSAVTARSARPAAATSAGTLAVRSAATDRTLNLATSYAKTSKAMYRPSPGTCAVLNLSGWWAQGLIWGLALQPEIGVPVLVAITAYQIIGSAMC